MATADIAAAPLTDLAHRSQLRRAVIASTVGTTTDGTIFWRMARWRHWFLGNCIFQSPIR
jgi:hypothetical protein